MFYIFNIFALFVWLTGQQANRNVCLLVLFSQKKHIFIWLFGWAGVNQLICVVYKFDFTGGLTLHLDLIWLSFLPIDCLLSDLIVCVLSLYILSLFHWYIFRWFCVFLYMVPSFVLIL